MALVKFQAVIDKGDIDWQGVGGLQWPGVGAAIVGDFNRVAEALFDLRFFDSGALGDDNRRLILRLHRCAPEETGEQQGQTAQRDQRCADDGSQALIGVILVSL